MVTDKSKPQRKQFEYKIFKNVPNTMREFNNLGKQGWEIVIFYNAEETTNFLAKREIIDEND